MRIRVNLSVMHSFAISSDRAGRFETTCTVAGKKCECEVSDTRQVLEAGREGIGISYQYCRVPGLRSNVWVLALAAQNVGSREKQHFTDSFRDDCPSFKSYMPIFGRGAKANPLYRQSASAKLITTMNLMHFLPWSLLLLVHSALSAPSRTCRDRSIKNRDRCEDNALL